MYVETPTRTFPSDGTAIGQYLRVKLSSGVLAVAGLTDKELGVAEYGVLSGDETGCVRLRTAPGTVPMVAAEALSAGAAVYTAASGKVGDTATATGFLIGTALTAATADGDIIEVLRNSHGDTANS